MPQIESELLPLYEADGLVVVPVLVGLDAGSGIGLVEQLGVTLPVALDLEGEVFRHYRLPSMVFPLNVVIDRTGTLVHADGNLETTEAEAAIVSALGA